MNAVRMPVEAAKIQEAARLAGQILDDGFILDITAVRLTERCWL